MKETTSILSLWLKLMLKTLLGTTVRWLAGGLLKVSKIKEIIVLYPLFFVTIHAHFGTENVTRKPVFGFMQSCFFLLLMNE